MHKLKILSLCDSIPAPSAFVLARPSIMTTMRRATVLAFTTSALGASEANSVCNNNTEPIQIRLAYAGADGMAVSWNTYQQLNEPTAYPGINPNALNRVAQSQISTTYPTSQYVSAAECVECQAAFEPLFLEYGVDLVLSGHKHFYERHAAVKNGTAQEINENSTSPWYIVNRAGGHYDGLDNPSTPTVPTSRRAISAYGWSLFTVHNCTHLSTQFIASGNKTVMDTATLIKNRVC